MAAILNALSWYSLLRGVLSPQRICLLAKELGYDKVALADYNNLYALPDFFKQCRISNIEPITSVCITHCRSSAILYADGADGYANICRIISEKHCNEHFDLITSIKSDPLGIHVVTDHTAWLLSLRETLPVYYAMYKPKIPPPEVKQAAIKSIVLPPMAFYDKQDMVVHQLVRAIDCNTTLSRISSDELLDPRCSFLSWNQVKELFEVFDYAIDATERFVESIKSYRDFGKAIMPRNLTAERAVTVLREMAYAGANSRYHTINREVTNRIEYELEIICEKEFAEYFLIVADIVKQSPRTCGRGSAAASIISYCLGITNVDPLRYNLMFERFLNPARVDPPDIDIDFAWDERDQVLDYVFEKYGENHAAMVANHLTFGSRMALRETARVYGMTEQEITTASKNIKSYSLYNSNSNSGKSSRSEVLNHPWPEIISLSQRLIGMPCGIGTHCGGVVITTGELSRHAPMQYSAKSRPILQWEKDGAEEMGLVKIDLLGNRSLAVIRDAIANLRQEGIAFHEKDWSPADDQATIDLLANGRTMGVFYVESPAMRLLQEKTGVGDFDHMVIHSSIIRPAANKYIREYIRRLHGASFTVEHPLLGEILKETFGIMVYQEDVARVAVGLAGFSHADADGLRKALSKKNGAVRLRDYYRAFVGGAETRGVSQAQIEAIWKMVMSFSGYSFCKPHSASYVQVSFQSAYLKTHYPAAFMAAVISNFGGFYTTQAYISESQRMGLVIISPDVNRSGISCVSEGRSIIVGLSLIKGLSSECRTRLIEERKRGGAYTSLQDLLIRIGMREADGACLIDAGACDSLIRTGGALCESAPLQRPELFWMLRRFFCSAGISHADTGIPALNRRTSRHILTCQYAALGFLASSHPVQYVRPPDMHMRIAMLRGLTGKNVSFCGWCVTHRSLCTVHDEPMQFITFEDETGIMETVLFPDSYALFARHVVSQEAFLISGTVTEEFGVAVVEISCLSPVRAGSSRTVVDK